MDDETARRFARIEGKINILGRAILWTFTLVVGFAVYFASATIRWRHTTALARAF